MGYVKRQSLKDSIVLLIATCIGAINTILIYPYFLSESQYGLIKFLLDTTGLFALFITLGSASAAVRFFPDFRNPQKQHHGFLAIPIVMTVIGSLLFLTALFISQPFWQSELAQKDKLILEYAIYIPLTSIFLAFSSLLVFYCINLHRTVIPSIISNLLFKISLPCFIIIFGLMHTSFSVVVNGFVGIYVIILFAMLGYVHSQNALHIKLDFSFISFRKLKKIVTFSLYTVLGGLGSLIANKIDTIMVGWLINLANLGVFGVAQYISTVIAIPTTTINKILTASIIDAFKVKDYETISNLYKRSSIISFCAALFLFVNIWVSIDDFFALMPKGEIFAQGKYVVLILGLTKLIDIVTGINSQIIGYSTYFRFNFYITLFLSVLNILTNIALIPIYHINGAALATLASVSIFNTAKGIFVWHKFNIHPFSKSTFKIIFISIIVYGIVISIPNSSYHLLNILVRSTVITITFTCSLLYFNISSDITDVIKNSWNKLLLMS